jgi:hypothetical protein
MNDEMRNDEPTADRPPTPEEEQAAEAAEKDVDVERAEEHFREMTELGAHVQGEGEIEPEIRGN